MAMVPRLKQNFRYNSSIGEENRVLTWESEDTHSNLRELIAKRNYRRMLKV
jgi:hypothetical protein